MIRVLFVCLGNICRSPTAEGVFRHLVESQGLSSHIDIDSCGTGGWHVGGKPDERAREEAQRRGISLDDLRARQIAPNDFEDFDYILGMDAQNISNLKSICPAKHQHKIRLFLEFAPAIDAREVPDPYYGGPDGFRDVFDMIEAASKGLLDDIRSEFSHALQ